MNWKSYVAWLLSALMPKRNTAVVHTWPSFDDTARALVPELAKSSVTRVYYLAASSAVAGKIPAWGENVTVLPKRSWRAFWAFVTSRYVLTTHQCFTSKFPHRVESINLWHGMPLKRLGWMSRKRVNLPHFKIDLATSEFWRPIVQQCMRPWGGVLVNGLPRCDRFAARGRAGVCRQLGGEAATCRKLFVWLATYRQAVRGDPENDGTDFQNEVQLPEFDADGFEQWLAVRNLVCVIKPHPLGPRPNLRTAGHLRILDDAALGEHGLTLYELLGGSDVLLTDLSSVYFDYLRLDRPVIHAFADRKAYQDSRGFTFNWTDDFLAGPMVMDMSGVERALEDVVAGRDTHAAERARLRELFHADPDSPATPALLAQLGLEPVAK